MCSRRERFAKSISEARVVDVRVLSATHRALREEVARRRFREDLMYRIRVVPLFLPPLVEREGDVEALTWHFIQKFNARQRQRRAEQPEEDIPWREIEAIAPDAHARMLAYPWPGNVRELRNVIEYAFAIGEGPVLESHELPPELRGEPPPRATRVLPLPGATVDDERDARLFPLVGVDQQHLRAGRRGRVRRWLLRFGVFGGA